MAGDPEQAKEEQGPEHAAKEGMLGTPPVAAILGPLDDAPVQGFHLWTVFMCACGWIEAGWEYVMMTFVIYMIAFTKFYDRPEGIPVLYSDFLRVSLFLGSFFGQLFWGFMGDRYGRKKMFLIENVYTMLALVLTASATWGPGTVVVWLWVAFRLLVGFGIGGEYSLAAILTSEFACKRWRGAMVGSVFAAQTVGHVLSAAVGLAVVVGLKPQMKTCVLGEPCGALDKAWRILLAISLIPSFAIFLIRNFLPESPRYTLFSMMNAFHAHRDVRTTLAIGGESSVHHHGEDLSNEDSLWDYLREPGVARKLLACMGAWFLKDINFSTIMLWGGTILNAGFDKEVQVLPGRVPGHTIYDLWTHTWMGLVLFYLSTNVIGFSLCVSLIDIVGRKPLQAGGFFMSAVFLGAAAIWHDEATPKTFSVLLIMALLLANIGPNLTVFVVPSELFKTKFRCRCFSFAAASGRAGTIISLLAMNRMMERSGYGRTLALLAACALLGVLVTLLLPEGKGKSLEELSGDTFNGKYVPKPNSRVSSDPDVTTADVKLS